MLMAGMYNALRNQQCSPKNRSAKVGMMWFQVEEGGSRYFYMQY
jgi:hypothetical protein